MPNQEKIEQQPLNLGDRDYLLLVLQDSLTRIEGNNFILDLGETQSLILLKALEVWASNQAMAVIRASLENRKNNDMRPEGETDGLPFDANINQALRKSKITTLAELLEVVAKPGSKELLLQNKKITQNILKNIVNYLYYHLSPTLDSSLQEFIIPLEELTIAQAHFNHRLENSLRRNFETLGDVLLRLQQPGAKEAFLSIWQLKDISLQVLINKLIHVYEVDASELDSSLGEYVNRASL